MGILAGIGKVVGAVLPSIAGGLLGKKSQEDANERNYQMQKEFAQNSIRWKVADARAAGVHPLFALGASTNAASPSFNSSNIGDHVAQGLTGAMNAKANALAMKQAAELNSAMIRKENALADKYTAEAQDVAQQMAAASFAARAAQAANVVQDAPEFILPFGAPLTGIAGRTPNSVLQERYGEAADLIGAAQLAEDVFSGPTTRESSLGSLNPLLYYWLRRDRTARKQPARPPGAEEGLQGP